MYKLVDRLTVLRLTLNGSSFFCGGWGQVEFDPNFADSLSVMQAQVTSFVAGSGKLSAKGGVAWHI
jgi:hypothetical protein